MENQRIRRVKILWITEDEILWAVVTTNKILPYHFLKLNYEGVPDDVKIERVIHDPWRRAIGLLVSHPTFDEVPDGMPAPDYWNDYHGFVKTATALPVCPEGFTRNDELLADGRVRIIYEEDKDTADTPIER